MIDTATEDTVSMRSTAGTVEGWRLLQAQRDHGQRLASIGQLAVGIAHEINSPTQYIGDNVRFLRDAFEELRPLLAACAVFRRAAAGRGETAKDAHAALAEAAEQAEQLEYLLGEIPKAIHDSVEGVSDVSQIIRSLKEFSHPGNGEKKAIDVNRAVKVALTVSRSEWKHVAQAVADLAPGLPNAFGRPGDLDQVLVNLIVNAAHAIEAKEGRGDKIKETIAIRTRQVRRRLEVEVADTGTGIPEAIRDRIFEPFFTTKQAGLGTGQGLAIARAIVVDRYGGELTFETEEGRGTTFRIRIPASGQAQQQEEER